VYSVPPACPVQSHLGSLIHRNTQLCAVLTDAVQPYLLQSSYRMVTMHISMQKLVKCCYMYILFFCVIFVVYVIFAKLT